MVVGWCLCEGLPALLTTFPKLHKESSADFALVLQAAAKSTEGTTQREGDD